MFFGHNGEAETLRCLADSGLRVRDSSVEKQNNEEELTLPTSIAAQCRTILVVL
jgi:hypothetical protein